MLKTNYTVWNETKEESFFVHLFDSVAEEVVYHVVCCAVLLLTLTGNSLVISMILSSKSLQTVFNLLILNMAVADLVYGFTGLSFYGSFVSTYHVDSRNGFVAGAAFDIIACQFTLCTSNIFNKISVFTVALISLERYLAIKHPLKHKNYVSKKKTLLAIVFSWFVSILFSTAFIVYILNAFKNTPVMSSKRLSCHDFAVSNKMPPDIVIFIELLAGYVMPMIIIVVTSYKIIKILWRPCVEQEGANIAVLRSRRQVTKLILTVAVAFNVFWLPWAIFLVLILTGTITAIKENEKLFFAVVLVQFANSGANPVLYSIRSRNFRRRLANMLCRKSQRKKLKE